MPKYIENLHEKIIEVAKNQLLTVDYGKFTIRSVAKECEIAIGTIYNYFPSKDMLAASVMLKDWKSSVKRMKALSMNTLTIIDGLKGIYDEIDNFSSIYKDIWSGYSYTSNFAYEYSTRHTLLLKQLSQVVHDILIRFHIETDDYLDNFIAENLLSAAMKQSDYKALANILKRLF